MTAPPTALDALVAERIHRHGPVRFGEVLDLALYHPVHGFYSSGGVAGRRGDFITSPEVGPLFGAVVARALDAWWDELGRPDPFVVVDAGAGRGALARTVLEAAPSCLRALTYVLVEQSPALRARHTEHLTISDPTLALPPVVGDPDDDRSVDGGHGPRFVSLPDLPAVPVTGVILANELLDNLPFDVLERAPDGWLELRIALAEDGGLRWLPVPAHDAVALLATEVAPDARPGCRVPVQHAAGAWVRDALERLERGRLVILDYADTTAGMADRDVTTWLRTYRAHERGVDPLSDLGLQDVTCDVAVDQLARIRPPVVDEDQACFLRRFGIDDLVEEGRQVWEERGHIGDLAAIKGRSRVREAEALLDPAGLGAFRVLQWTVA